MYKSGPKSISTQLVTLYLEVSHYCLWPGVMQQITDISIITVLVRASEVLSFPTNAIGLSLSIEFVSTL